MFRRNLPGRPRLHLALTVVVCLSFTGNWLYLPFHPSATKRTPICELQGDGFESPLQGEKVRIRGIVTLDLDQTARRGFYIQEVACDQAPSTSDGVFIYLGARLDVVAAGDLAEVSGYVEEYYARTEVVASATNVSVLSRGNTLPAPHALSPPFEMAAARVYFESLEGMYVKLDQAAVVGPTDANDQTWAVRADLGIGRVFQGDPSGAILCVDDGGHYEITPEAKVGDQVSALAGVLDYTGGLYCLQLSGVPSLTPAKGSETPANRSQPVAPGSALTLATFNLSNLFDTSDDPFTNDTVLSAAEYQRRLQKRALAIHEGLGEPAILAVQEAEHLGVLQALAARPEIESDYAIVWENGPDRRGLDLGLLYRPDRVSLLDYQVRQGCTALVDGLGPDGNQDLFRPQNTLTCDRDGDGVLDGNRLFARPPLLARFAVAETVGTDGEIRVDVIANHWKSKIEDTQDVAYTLPRRLEQAGFVAGLVREILAERPEANIIVLGDLNDFPNSEPLEILSVQGLGNLWLRVEPSSRYSYIYQGLSQVLDYVLVRLALPLAPLAVTPVHLNADYPCVFEGVGSTAYRSSDHDLFLVTIRRFEYFVFLPVTMR